MPSYRHKNAKEEAARDDDLTDRIRAGDESAAEELIRKYYEPLFRFLLFHTGVRETAEDLTQETFYRFFSQLHRYRKYGQLRAYLYAIARHCLIDAARKAKRGAEADAAYRDALSAEEAAGIFRDTEMQNAELRLLLSGYAKMLSEEQREILLLRFSEGLSLREIGKVLALPARTVQSRLRRALTLLRKEIAKDEEE